MLLFTRVVHFIHDDVMMVMLLTFKVVLLCCFIIIQFSCFLIVSKAEHYIYKRKLPYKRGDSYAECRARTSEPKQRPWSPHHLKLKAFCLSEVHMMHKFVHFCYPVNCSNILFERMAYYCISVWSHFTGRYTVTKSVRKPESLGV